MTKHKVVVLGAGYSGVMAALRAADQADVTLIAPSASFTERVREHELAAGRPSIAHPLSSFIQKKPVTSVAARATRIDPDQQQIHTDDGGLYSYDFLVYALGSHTASVPADGRVFTAENAGYLRKRLDDGPGTLTVVGGGATGVEIATELASRGQDWKVRMVTAGEIGQMWSPRARDYVRSVFTDMGIDLVEGRKADPDDIDSDVVVWAASLTPNIQLAADTGITLNNRGRIAVDDTLRSVSHPNIYAVGDAAGDLRMACAVALPMGKRAGKNIARQLRGWEPKPLSFRYYLQCMSLGRADGLVQLVHADDAPKQKIFTGKRAAFVKEQIVRSTVRWLRQAGR
ncbi:NAD(P)/FAD-dependent oxidoreductase [Kibdelosporangium aridum]|uniref:NADH dehydrogenase, FAD-containing subunit n=1 Tax=Kibdelosporangium aridum TaxID=2030 RepID=A0A1W2FJI7_KIBAR|nr:FAD-dependent oxidoreductase [Kibdelosporangium aridum]SMD22060.1 NADH dehydrogenase, FAD-containing subunit [Kibdelosporangium aridum]